MNRNVRRGPVVSGVAHPLQRGTARSMTRATPIPFKEPVPSATPADNQSGMPKTPTGTHDPIPTDDTDGDRGGLMDWLDELGS
ncbi:MAG: hypothetical protein ACRDQU_01595 [Pseudonocardiaceae bacterium]